MGFVTRGTIKVIAAVTIFFGVISLSIQIYGIVKHVRHEERVEFDLLHPTPKHHIEQVKSHSTIQEKKSFKDELKTEFDHEYEELHKSKEPKKDEKDEENKTSGIQKSVFVFCAGIFYSGLSIAIASLVFFAVTDDTEKNVERRHFLLPFIVYHFFFSVVGAVFILFLLLRDGKVGIATIVLPVLLNPIFAGMSLKYYTMLLAKAKAMYIGFNNSNNIGKSEA